MTLPKVLIFGQPFNKRTGGGITLSNLFAGWDKDKIAVSSTGHEIRDLDLSICDTYYQLGEKEYKWLFPFNYLQRNFSSGLLNFTDKFSNNKPTPQGSSLRRKVITSFFYPVLKYIGCFHFISKIKFSEELRQWLKTFNPDILYVQVTQREGILFARELHSYLKRPMLIHIMDDWPSTISDRGLFKKYWHKKIDSEFRTLLDKASVLLSISEDMAEEYKARYGKNFITFHNPIDKQFWKKCQRTNYDLNRFPVVLYAGRIGIGIERSLEKVAKAIEKINNDLQISLKFILQTMDKPVWLNKYNCVEHRSFVPYQDLPKEFSRADFLIMPYDFSDEAIRYIRYSMPTKLPEYMISGTPVIIFAPEETTIVKYSRRNKCAEVITKNNYTDLAEGIKSLIEDKERRQEIAQNAIKIAEENHDSLVIREEFKKIICSLYNETK
ncbi:MAG: glycosyltransferase [Chitinophagales bacterium]